MARDNETYEDEEYEDDEEYEKDEEEKEEEDLDPGQLIEQELKEIYREMKKWPKTSREYMILSQRATDATERKRNYDESVKDRVQATEMKGQRFVPFFQIFGNIVGSAAGAMAGQWLNRKTVNDVLDCERDGYIVNSKSTGFIQKPRS